MQLVPKAPAIPLDTLVETMFYFRGYCPEHEIERIVPDGSINLVIELDGQTRHVVDNGTLKPVSTQTRAWLSGVHINYISITALQDSELLAVRFFPGGAYPFVHRSIGDLADRVEPAAAWFGSGVLSLRERICKLPDAEAKLIAVEQWLTDHFRTDLMAPDGIRVALQKIQANPTVSQLNGLAEASGYSQKQFIHLFRRHVGVSPKLFQRILRFSQVLPQLQNEEHVNWAELGVDCGYYDQAHFIRDFRSFSGYNPQDYLDKHHERLNFFPID